MRLQGSQEFRRVWAEGRSWAHPLFILWAAPNGAAASRAGITASRKVGGAVQRNRARRLLREALRLQWPHLRPGWDLVLVARAPLLEVKSAVAVATLKVLLLRADLWIAETQEDNG